MVERQPCLFLALFAHRGKPRSVRKLGVLEFGSASSHRDCRFARMTNEVARGCLAAEGRDEPAPAAAAARGLTVSALLPLGHYSIVGVCLRSRSRGCGDDLVGTGADPCGCRVCRLDRSLCRESDSVPRGPVPNQRPGTDLSDSFPGGPPEPPCADARINVVLARGAFYRNVSPGLTPSFLKNQATGQNRVKPD